MLRRIKNLFLLSDGKKIFLFYLVGKSLPRDVKAAESQTGISFKTGEKKISLEKENLEKINEAKAVKLGKQFFLSWEKGGKAFGATSTNLNKWNIVGQLIGLKSPGAVVPDFYYDEDRIMYVGDKKSIKIAFSVDLKKWRLESGEELFRVRKGSFDSDVILPGAAFVRDEGIFLAYYAYDKNKKFSLGLALFNKDNPEELLWRADEPVWIQDDKEKLTPVSVVDRNGSLILYYEDSKGNLISVFMPSVWGWKNAKPLKAKSIFKKPKHNPLFGPRQDKPWESVAAFNPTAFQHDGKIYLLYRAIGDENISVIGMATSSDGLHIDERLDEPIYVPRFAFEGVNGNIDHKSLAQSTSGGGWGGCEDPKVVKIENRIYIVYVAFNGYPETNIAMSSISVNDFLARKWTAWKRPVLITSLDVKHKNPAAIEAYLKDKPWAPQVGIGHKNPSILPEKINGKYVIFHRIWPNIVIDYVDDLNFDGQKFLKGQYMIPARTKMWDSHKIGIGGAPLKIKEGWLVFYNAVDKRDMGKYKIGAMILKHDDPAKVLYRSSQAIIEPEEDYENKGHKFGVVFAGGSTIKDNQLFLYYGGSDKYACVATASLDKFVAALIKGETPKMTKTKIIL
jgi:beta-1,2-mannobiose phosphorylase / 1,2-beta-oligomannan phosphorylase